jgi:hypothetical protein
LQLFAALPGGNGNPNGDFNNVGKNGNWWSGTENNADNAWNRNMNSDNENVNRNNNDKRNLLSVRCAQRCELGQAAFCCLLFLYNVIANITILCLWLKKAFT